MQDGMKVQSFPSGEEQGESNSATMSQATEQTQKMMASWCWSCVGDEDGDAAMARLTEIDGCGMVWSLS